MLVEKVFELLSVTSLDVQRELLAVLPEVVSDSFHPRIADSLK